jgi:hypothetical protein
MVIGVALKCYRQLHADDRGKGADAFQVDLVPDGAYFLRTEGRGIKAMLVGVLVARLTAAFAFLHSGMVAQMFVYRQGKVVVISPNAITICCVIIATIQDYRRHHNKGGGLANPSYRNFIYINGG